MFRFAPSSTENMSIGELRLALFNYVSAKQCNEDLIVRVKGEEKEILELLSLFGIEYTQVIPHSQQLRFHSAMALQLLHEKKAFSCFCSDAWIDTKKQEAKEANKEYLYDDACRNLPAELVIDNENPFCVRVVRPQKDLIIKDRLQGDISFKADTIDSFMIMYQDKTPTADFSIAVDDMLNDISLIVCDEQEKYNNAKQVHVRNALEYAKEIEYLHLPSFENADISVKKILEEGILPEAILNYLVSSLDKEFSEVFTLQEILENFHFEKISSSPFLFDIEELKKTNQNYMKKMDLKELSRYVGFADEEIGGLAKLYLNDVFTTKELKTKIAPIFQQTRDIPSSMEENMQQIRTLLQQATYFENYEDFYQYLTTKTKMEKQTLENVLALLFTNSMDAPELKEIYKYLKNYLGEIVK